ncbi:MAG: sigma-54 dependent transcriptional regulator [Planctomycetota bacterium]|nr:sigma-54 dependent transcriptional regulator [Planctomycetota bacterium]
MTAAESPVRLLIVDDDEGHADALADALEIDGYACRVVDSGRDAIGLLDAEPWDAVLTDLKMPDVTGLEVLAQARVQLPGIPVLVITGHASWETARDAIQGGATDYLSKPVDLSELRTKLGRAVENALLRKDHDALVRQNVELRRQIDKRYGFEGILGHSPQMQRVFEILGQVASSTATVLILGESGTGKELVARAVHSNSPRAERNFVAVNCAALSEGLIESELFGHRRGAFTGAVSDKEGRIAYADGGTLFLDEVGDMPLPTQAKLLRVLETREVTQVGGNEPRKVDLRLVAATNRDLHAMVKTGEFREDLLFRLQVVTVDLPGLRDRTGDVPLLVDHFLTELAAEHGRPVKGVTPEARALLVRYGWPGNVRELRNAVENMVLLARGELLTVQDVPESIKGGEGGLSAGGFDLAGRSLREVEQELIRINLELMEGNRAKTAQVLGIGERTLYRKIKEYEL